MEQIDDKYLAAKQASNFDLLENAIKYAEDVDCRLENFEINNLGQITRAYFQRKWEKNHEHSTGPV